MNLFEHWRNVHTATRYIVHNDLPVSYEVQDKRLYAVFAAALIIYNHTVGFVLSQNLCISKISEYRRTLYCTVHTASKTEQFAGARVRKSLFRCIKKLDTVRQKTNNFLIQRLYRHRLTPPSQSVFLSSGVCWPETTSMTMTMLLAAAAWTLCRS
jgi:hypothetical protein